MLHIIHTGYLALSLCFIQHQCSCYRYIERLHHAYHRDHDILIAHSNGFVSHTVLLLPKQNSRGLGVIDVAKIYRFVG